MCNRLHVICVDDEKIILDHNVALCERMPLIESVQGFSFSSEALEYVEEHPVELALLDIDMPDINGIELADRIKKKSPKTAIIFITGFNEYTLDAFAVHASGYLMKPYSRDKLYEEIEYVFSQMFGDSPTDENKSIRVQTFGTFDVFVDGEQVNFGRSKAKELFAYLVDKRGSSVTRVEVFSELWEEGDYDRSMQKQLDVIIRSLRSTLADYGISEVLSLQRGNIRIRPELLDCDMYRFMDGDADTIRQYKGEYMSSYAWATELEGYLTQVKQA